ncbi:MAG TPA: rRNA maturation RNAse YbeY, partial [Acidimicrobiales bacterium]|nr:rRNA maturation RNAse YbeY [Acidimicrobiales bacterium]
MDDSQDARPIDVERWRALASDALDDLGVPVGAELSITFVSSSTMAELNHEHMGHDGPTDVL